MTTSPTPDPDKATPSPAVEEEELEAACQNLHHACDWMAGTLAADVRLVLSTIGRLASDKARLEGENARLLSTLEAKHQGVEDLCAQISALEQSNTILGEKVQRAEAERDALKAGRDEALRAFEGELARRDQIIRQMPSIGDALAEAFMAVTDGTGGYSPHPQTVLAGRRNARSWLDVRRAAELHASLRSSEGQPTDEGQRANTENLLTKERK